MRKKPQPTPSKPVDHPLNQNEVARRSVSSGFVLAIGNFSSNAIMVVASVIIARLLGPSGFGLYGLALTAPAFLQTFAGLGLSHAVQRYSSFYLAKGDYATARRMTRNAIIFVTIIGSALALLTFFGASFMSLFLLHRAGLTNDVEISSSLVLLGIFVSVLTSAFNGWGISKFASATSILLSAVKLFLSPVLIVVGLGVLGGIAGQLLAYLSAAVFAFVIIYSLRLRVHNAETSCSNAIKDFWKQSLFASDIREMLRFGLPAFFGNSLSGFSVASFVLIVLSAIVSNTALGYYQAAWNVTQAIFLLSGAVSLSLFSAFSSLDGLGSEVRTPFKHAVTYGSLVMTPVVLLVVVVSGPLVEIFYGRAFEQSGVILAFLAICYLPSALGLTVMPSFFNGIGRSRLSMVMLLLQAGLDFMLVPFFSIVLGFGILGAVYALIFGNIGATLAGAYLAKRYIDCAIEYKAVARIFVASDVSALAVYVISIVIASGPIEMVILALLVFSIIYLTLIPLLRALTMEDFERLRMSASGLGVFGRLLRMILNYEMYLLEKSERKKRSA